MKLRHACIVLLFGLALGLGVSARTQMRVAPAPVGLKMTTAGITASTNQAQGQQPLDAGISEVDVVANPSDVVTAPPAQAGEEFIIFNNGANTLQIFPASGDNLGAGANISVELELNESASYACYDSTNCRTRAATEIIHAEMFDVDNTDAFLIVDATGDSTLYHTNGMQAGDLAGWTFDTGGAGTSFPIASIADSPTLGGSQAQITTTGSHLLAAGDIVSLSNLSAGTNTGLFVVTAPITATEFEIISTNSTNATGTMDQAAVLIADTGSAGQYMIQWTASGTAETNNDTFEFHVTVGAADVASTAQRRKFAVGADIGSMSGVSIITIADGDRVGFDLANVTAGAGDITLRDFTFVLVRL